MKTYFHQAYISFLCMLHTELNQNGWPSVIEPPWMALMCHVMYCSLNIQRTSQRPFWCIESRLLLTSPELHLFSWRLYYIKCPSVQLWTFLQDLELWQSLRMSEVATWRKPFERRGFDFSIATAIGWILTLGAAHCWFICVSTCRIWKKALLQHDILVPVTGFKEQKSFYWNLLLENISRSLPCTFQAF